MSTSPGILANVLRWAARVVGTLAALGWLLILVVAVITKEEPWTYESTILVVLNVSSALGVLLAWRQEGRGGLFLTACGVAGCIFGAVAAGHNKIVAMLITGGPFVVAGLLFIAAWWLSADARAN